VERAIQILKKRLKITDGSVKSRLAQVLLAFRITPQVRLEYHQLTCTRTTLSKSQSLSGSCGETPKEVKRGSWSSSTFSTFSVWQYGLCEKILAMDRSGYLVWLFQVPVSYYVQLSGRVWRRYMCTRIGEIETSKASGWTGLHR